MTLLEMSQELFRGTLKIFIGLTVAFALIMLSFPWGPLIFGTVVATLIYKKKYGTALPPWLKEAFSEVTARREAFAAGAEARTAKRAAKASAPVARPEVGRR
jgi:hypothetical protein